MTDLDIENRAPGLYDSAWPAECGGLRRQKIVRTPGPAIQRDERLTSTTRDTGGWAVMFVQRGDGELYLQCGAALAPGEIPPVHRATGPSAGWVERVDPITLETIERSPDLDSGGWLWCGATVVHANGDLYVVNGRYVHRLDPACRLVASRQLPVDGPYNGIAVLSDGNLLTRNLGFRPDDVGTFTLLDPDLDPVGDPFVLPECTMGRFSVDLTATGEEFVYSTTASTVRRLRYVDRHLELDPDWQRSYRIEPGHTDAWDTTIGDDNVWLMDSGRPAGWEGEAGSTQQRAFRFSLDDPDDFDVVEAIGHANAWNPGPPLYDPIRHVLVHYDSLAGVVVAHRYADGELTERWRHPMRNFVQMLCWADTGELVVEDAHAPALDPGAPSGDAVVLDIETGAELGRAPTGNPATFGMFCCPGFGRDFYVAGIPGGVARVSIAR